MLSNKITKFLLVAAIFSTFACVPVKGLDPLRIDPLDRESNLTRDDINDYFVKSKKDKKSQNQSKEDFAQGIPKISGMIASPLPPQISTGKTISFAVTDQIPLKDVLIELGRVAKIDIDIDANITGGVNINATNRPLQEVIDRIATSANLRYTFKNGILHFEQDAPFLKNYFVDYLIDGTLWGEVTTNISSIIAISDGTNAPASTSTATANKSAGMITVYATTRQQKNVEKYLADVQKNSSAQVLIEAKVVEVTLSDYYSSGIEWSSLFDGNLSAPLNFASNPAGTVVVNLGKIVNLGAVIKLIDEFGIVKAIASPRIHAINNQKASLAFNDKKVYFTVTVETTDAVPASGGSAAINAKTTLTSTKNEADIGVKLDITPSINLKTNEILMNIKPIISTTTEDAVDPALSYAVAQLTTPLPAGVVIENKIPIIQTRELQTIMKLKSGGVLVIGGLLKNENDNQEKGVPFLSKIPIIGYLFKSTAKVSTTVETVIFIKATIVNSSGLVDDTDREFHNKFTSDKKQFLR